MSDRDRQWAAAIEAIVGAILAIAGLLLIRHPGVLRLGGEVFGVIGVVGLIHAVALGLGLVSLPDEKRDRRR